MDNIDTKTIFISEQFIYYARCNSYTTRHYLGVFKHWTWIRWIMLRSYQNIGHTIPAIVLTTLLKHKTRLRLTQNYVGTCIPHIRPCFYKTFESENNSKKIKIWLN